MTVKHARTCRCAECEQQDGHILAKALEDVSLELVLQAYFLRMYGLGCVETMEMSTYGIAAEEAIYELLVQDGVIKEDGSKALEGPVKMTPEDLLEQIMEQADESDLDEDAEDYHDRLWKIAVSKYREAKEDGLVDFNLGDLANAFKEPRGCPTGPTPKG